MTWNDLLTTLADHGDFDTQVGSFAWRAVEAWLNINGEVLDNDNQMRLLVGIACHQAKSEYPCFQILTSTR